MCCCRVVRRDALIRRTFGNQDSASANAGKATPDFANDIVVLRVSERLLLEQKSHLLYVKNAAIKKIGGKSFVVGVLSDICPNTEDTRNTLWAGAEIGVPWGSVAGYYTITTRQFKDILSHEAERAN